MNRISPGTVTIGVFAILFGLIAAYTARHLLNVKPAQPPAVAGPEMASIVVPRINLPKFSRIREADLDVIQVPVGDAPEGAVRSRSRALFRLVKETTLAGQPLLEVNLFPVDEVPTLSDRLPPGFRAVTLTIDSNSALNGMIQPDSYVDVTLTVTGDKPELGGMATMTLMQNVHVMATSQGRFKAYEDFPNKLRNVTVAVTPEQANKLILAQQYGALSVTLRSSAEGELLATDGSVSHMVDPFDLLGLPRVKAPQPVAEEIAKTVEIWRGGKMQEITFRGNRIRESLNATAAAQGLQPNAMIPVSSAHSAAPKKKECKSCKKKKDTQAAADARASADGNNADQPTLARPIGFGAPSTTSMISVPVEIGSGGTVDR